MSVDVAETDHETRDGRDVSGSVINVLLALVHDQGGDSGVAQVFALAGESRTFAALGDQIGRAHV